MTRTFLVSGIFFKGPPMRILEAWTARKFELIVTLEVLSEYRRVGARLGRRFPDVVDPIPVPASACDDRTTSCSSHAPSQAARILW